MSYQQQPQVIGAEVAPVQTAAAGNADGAQETAVVLPTQMRRPWRATARTIFAALLALITLLPLIALEVYESPDAYPAAVAQVLAIAGLVTRVLAMPGVESFLQSYLPFLSAAGRPPQDPNPAGAGEGGHTTLELILLIVTTVAVVLMFLGLGLDITDNPRR